MRRWAIRALLLGVSIHLTIIQPHTWSTGFLDGVLACDLGFAAMSFIFRGPRVTATVDTGARYSAADIKKLEEEA